MSKLNAHTPKKIAITSAPRRGAERKGTISNVMPYGFFVKFGMHSGLCHFSNVPPGFNRTKFRTGQMVIVRIVEIRPENKFSLALIDMAQDASREVILTRTAQQYRNATMKLRAQDLELAQADRERRKHEERKFAAKQNAQTVPSPKTLTELEALGIKPSKKKKNLQGAKSTVANKAKTKKKKAKRRSVWTISGGAFESNRRKH